MNRSRRSTSDLTRKSRKRSATLNRQLDLLGGIYQAGLKYQPVWLEPSRITNPRTFKYEYIKAVHLVLPLGEDSIDTKSAIVEARRMTRSGKEAMLIIRKVAKKP